MDFKAKIWETKAFAMAASAFTDFNTLRRKTYPRAKETKKNMNNAFTKIENRYIAAAAVIIAVLMIIGGVWDYPISQAVTDQNSWFATIFQDFGMFPAYLIPMISGLVIAGAGLRRGGNQTSKWAQVVGGFGLAWCCAILNARQWLKYANIIRANLADGLPVGKYENEHAAFIEIPFDSVMTIAFIVFAAVCTFTYFWLKNKNNEQLRYLTVIAVGGIAAALLSAGIVEFMKVMWGRCRPYEILLYDTENSRFTPWWVINGVNGHKSFPSGHSATAAGMLYLPFFVGSVRLQKIATALCAAYMVTMMYTRVRLGAHHLSDVTAGAGITLLIIFGVSRALNHYFTKPKGI